MALFAVKANPYTDRASMVEEHSGFKTGDIVQVKEWHGKWMINSITVVKDYFINVHLYKLGRTGQPTKYNSTTQIENLMSLDAKQPDTDKNGLSAKEYAEQIFKTGYAVHDYVYTTRQSLVRVLSVSKTGRVKIQRLRVLGGVSAKMETIMVNGETQTRPSQEINIIDWSRLKWKVYGEPETYTPRLHNGEWKFWHGDKYIQQPGMKLEWLLD